MTPPLPPSSSTSVNGGSTHKSDNKDGVFSQNNSNHSRGSIRSNGSFEDEKVKPSSHASIPPMTPESSTAKNTISQINQSGRMLMTGSLHSTPSRNNKETTLRAASTHGTSSGRVTSTPPSYLPMTPDGSTNHATPTKRSFSKDMIHKLTVLEGDYNSDRGFSSSLQNNSSHQNNYPPFMTRVASPESTNRPPVIPSRHNSNGSISGSVESSMSTRKQKSVGSKIFDRISKFDSRPNDPMMLSPMQGSPIKPNSSSGLSSAYSYEDKELVLSPLHPPPSVTTRRRKNRHKNIENKMKMFDSPTPQNNGNSRNLLLSPQDVRELVRSSNTNHRLDQILHRYEHLSEEDSKQRRRLAAKISARERRRRLGTTTAGTEARRSAWEKTRARFREGNGSDARSARTSLLIYGDTSSSKDKKKKDTSNAAFDKVTAVRYDFSDFTPPTFEKTEEQRKLILDAVKRDFVFAEFRKRGDARTDGALDALVEAFEPISFPPSHVLIDQGVVEGNDCFYILEDGSVDLQKHGASIGQVAGVGDSFGQLALLYHSPSNVTISVSASSTLKGLESGAKLLKIDQKTYRGLLQEYSARAAKEKRDALLKVEFLRELFEEDETLSDRLASVMIRKEFKSGETFTVSEDSSFQFILSGKMDLFDTAEESSVPLEPGDHFGGRALIESRPRTSNVDSETRLIGQSNRGVFFTIDRQSMEQILGKGRLQKLQDMKKLASTALVKKLSTAFRSRMTSVITERKLEGGLDNAWKIEKSQKPELYVVREGSVLVSYNDPETGETRQDEMNAGDVFGHEQIKAVTVDGRTRFERTGEFTTSTPDGKHASVGVLPLDDVRPEDDEDPKAVEGHLPPICPSSKETISSHASTMMQPSKEAVQSQNKIHRDSPALQLRWKVREAVENVPFESLEKIRLLGEGEFGEVWLVTADVFQTGVPELRQNFALKTQFRRSSSRGGADATAEIMREVNILKEVDHPQVVDLVHTYTDEASIHILMGLIPGGELWDLIHKEDDQGNWISGLSEDNSKFVTLVVADILDFMHTRDIVYRDLKPENIMMDADGYPVLVDFGFAKYCHDKTYTFVGTPNYVAPEIIKNAGHNRSVDYWALGVTIYEMVTGENPFFYEGMDQVSLYIAICDEDHYPLSDDRSESLIDFIRDILEKNPTKRLGMLAGGCNDIFHHPWLSGFDLDRIRTKSYPSPWNAQVKDEEAEKDILQQMGMNMPMPLFDDSVELNESHDADDSRVSVQSITDDSIRSNSNVSMSEVEEEVVWLEENPSMSSTNDDHPEATHNEKKSDRKTADEVQEILHSAEEKLSGPRQEQPSNTSTLSESLTKSKKKVGKKMTSTKTLSPKKIEPKNKVKKGDSYQFVTPSDYTYFNIRDPKKPGARVGKKNQEESRNRRSALKGALRNIGIDSDDEDDEIQKFLGEK